MKIIMQIYSPFDGKVYRKGLSREGRIASIYEIQKLILHTYV